MPISSTPRPASCSTASPSAAARASSCSSTAAGRSGSRPSSAGRSASSTRRRAGSSAPSTSPRASTSPSRSRRSRCARRVTRAASSWRWAARTASPRSIPASGRVCAASRPASGPGGSACRPTRRRLYAASGLSGTLTIIDLEPQQGDAHGRRSAAGRGARSRRANEEAARSRCRRAAARLVQSRAAAHADRLRRSQQPPLLQQGRRGFENKLAQMIASDLHAKLDYIWWAQRRGYVRNTLNERKCDFWPGIGSNVEMVATTPALLSLDLHVRDPRAQRTSAA